MAVNAEGGDRPRLWIGTGQGDPPEALGDLAACLRDAGCPPGWVQLSTSGTAGRPIYVVAALERAEVARILRGMSLAPR